MGDSGTARDVDVLVCFALPGRAADALRDDLIGQRTMLDAEGTRVCTDVPTPSAVRVAYETDASESPGPIRRIVALASAEMGFGDTAAVDAFIAAIEPVRTLRVVLLLQRQDDGLSDFYQHRVWDEGTRESRSFEVFFDETGGSLADVQGRFALLRDGIGADRFHVLSVDDLARGERLSRRVLELAGAPSARTAPLDHPVLRARHPRAVETLAWRLVNAAGVENGVRRDACARYVRAHAPAGDVPLMPLALRDAIEARCKPLNTRLVSQWGDDAMPNACFGDARPADMANTIDAPALYSYIAGLMALLDETPSGRSEIVATQPASPDAPADTTKPRHAVGTLSRWRPWSRRRERAPRPHLTDQQRQWVDAIRPFFDEHHYFCAQPTLSASGVDPVVHYVLEGYANGADPVPWLSENGYRRANKDMANSPFPSLVHYVLHGRREGRSTGKGCAMWGE